MDVPGLAAAMQARFDEYVDALRVMVAIDSGTFTTEGVNRVADLSKLA